MAMKLNKYLSIDGYCCGHQVWWNADSIGNQFGCGVIAGLDGLLYRNIVGQPEISRSAYMALATEFWQVMQPNTGVHFRAPSITYTGKIGIGVRSAWKFKRGVTAFAKTYGYSPEYNELSNGLPWSDGTKNTFKAIAFIEASIEKNRPVHLLSWKDSIDVYSFHWITITGIEKINGRTAITLVTWGQERIIADFEAFWQRRELMDYKVMLTYD